MKKIIACIGTFFALVALSTQAKNPYLLQTADQSAMEHWVDSVFESLSPKERIAQLLVITVRNSDTPQNRKTLQRSYLFHRHDRLCSQWRRSHDPVPECNRTEKQQHFHERCRYKFHRERKPGGTHHRTSQRGTHNLIE